MNAPLREPQYDTSTVADDSIHLPLMQQALVQEDSGVPLIELLAALRKYYQLRDFSHRERFGAPDSATAQALVELDDMQRSLQRLAADARDSDRTILVNAQLSVQLTA